MSDGTVSNGWQPVIGIECHVELHTDSKMFCGCSAAFGAEPNTNICPVCLGLPGALPVPNRAAIDSIIKIGLALDCEVVDRSEFHRKNYFYADLPKNYQVSQYDVPICAGGVLEVDLESGPKRVRINRVHMEEDTGKTRHVGGGGRIDSAQYSLIDLNRSGVPLVEIVTEPDISSAEEARAYATQLRSLVAALGVSDARLEEGSMRFDANVSVMRADADEFGTRAEIKNMNSFRSLERAVAFEIERQISVLEGGGEVVQETRHWDEERGATDSMRTKEESSDYRYFQDPDLVPMIVDDSWRTTMGGQLPELPAARRARYRDLGLDAAAAGRLADAFEIGDDVIELAPIYDSAVDAGADPKTAANWLTGELIAHLRGEDETNLPTGAQVAELSSMVADAELSASAAKKVFVSVLEGKGDPRAIAESEDLLQISDEGELTAQVEAAIAGHPDEVERIKGGESKLLGFLVGQVMKSTGGKADPKRVNELLRQRLS